MASITIISETGFPHCALRINTHDWYGFKPALPKSPVAFGHVDRSDRSMFIKLAVTFEVPDHAAAFAVPSIAQQYAKQMYLGGVHDCVSFVADVAERLGLIIPPRPNFWPDNFVNSIRNLNAARIKP